jgi:hypothetical protein
MELQRLAISRLAAPVSEAGVVKGDQSGGEAGLAVLSVRSRVAPLLVASVLLLTAASLLVLMPRASADLPNAPDDSAQANGRVSAILRVGDRIYLGGNFTELTNPNGTTVSRNHLAAINASTGEVVAGWNPDVNGNVGALAASSDRSRIYAGGGFTTVGGVTHRRMASIVTTTGAVDNEFKASLGAPVDAIAVLGNSVYIGGEFTGVNGQPRTHLAKLNGTTGAVDPTWKPSADELYRHYGSVRGLAFSEDGSRLYVGGYFRTINNQPTGNLAALDPTTGAIDDGFRPNDDNGIQSLAVSNGRVFVGTGDNLEGIEAFDGVTGEREWYLGYGAHTAPEGDVQAIAVEGDTVYAGGHFTRMHDQLRNRLVAVDAATGTIDPQWTPKVNAGATGGGVLGVWAIDAQGPNVYVGGDFTTVSGNAQERYAQFTDGPERPLRGLTGEYFNNMDFTGTQMTRTDATINYNWGNNSPPKIESDTFSARWSGQVRPQYSETYTFYTTSDDGVRLWVNGQLVVDNWTDHSPTENSGQITLSAGQMYDVRMEFYENGGGAEARLAWSSSRQAKQIVPQSRLYPAQP